MSIRVCVVMQKLEPTPANFSNVLSNIQSKIIIKVLTSANVAEKVPIENVCLLKNNSILLNLRGWKTADKDAYWFSFEVSLFSPISNENLP